jgi:phage terminase large subunit-like protein
VPDVQQLWLPVGRSVTPSPVTALFSDAWRAALTQWTDTAANRPRWRDIARPEQLPPDDWSTIYWRGGRGSGKTRAASEAFAELIRNNPASEEYGNEWAVVAPTFGDCRDICIEGPSGLITALGGKAGGGRLIEKGDLISTWNRSMGQLYLNDGTVIYIDGADDGALRVQGKNLRSVWADEIGLWKQWATAWDESIKYAVRKFPAKRIVSGTPKRQRAAIILVRRLMHDPAVVTRRLRTEDNAANLDPAALARFLEAKGTALGAQELEGDVLDEAEGALWTRDPVKADADKLGLIITARATLSDETDRLLFTDGSEVRLGRRIVALDPAEGEGDEQGRTVVALGADRRYYVLHSAGEHLSPMGWLRATDTVFDRFRCDRVVYEKNGAMFLKPLLQQEFASWPLAQVWASQGKRTRAEPIAALYARRLVTHVLLPGEDLSGLEAQMTSFTGDVGEDSPGMIDSACWAIAHLHGHSRPARSTSVADMQIAG